METGYVSELVFLANNNFNSGNCCEIDYCECGRETAWD